MSTSTASAWKEQIINEKGVNLLIIITVNNIIRSSMLIIITYYYATLPLSLFLTAVMITNYGSAIAQLIIIIEYIEIAEVALIIIANWKLPLCSFVCAFVVCLSLVASIKSSQTLYFVYVLPL